MMPVEGFEEGIVGYPSHPIYKQIAHMLQIWMKTKNCPILDLPSYDLLDEQSYVEARAAVIKSITPLLDGILTLYTLWNEDELVYRLREILLGEGRAVSRSRALAKHHHRDQSESWWGTSVGTEKQKNEHAVTVINKILDNATWINIHWLPQDIFVIEARVAEGYGARWRADGSQFRGFLEPQMADGHEVGWKH